MRALTLGVGTTATHQIDESLVAKHLRKPVLSTPSMVGLIERACMALLAPSLETDETSVGVHVCVSHEATAALGESVVIVVEMSKLDGRRVTFITQVLAGERIVSRGTHERAVIRIRSES